MGKSSWLTTWTIARAADTRSRCAFPTWSASAARCRWCSSCTTRRGHTTSNAQTWRCGARARPPLARSTPVPVMPARLPWRATRRLRPIRPTRAPRRVARARSLPTSRPDRPRMRRMKPQPPRDLLRPPLLQAGLPCRQRSSADRALAVRSIRRARARTLPARCCWSPLGQSRENDTVDAASLAGHASRRANATWSSLPGPTAEPRAILAIFSA